MIVNLPLNRVEYIIRQDSNGIASGLLSVRGESAPLKEAKTMEKILEKVENQGDKRVVGNMRPEEKRKLNIARRLKYEMGEAMKWGEVEFYEAMQTQRTQDREDAKPGCNQNYYLNFGNCERFF